MASSESAPTVLNQERQPEVFSFWAFAHIHPQRMGWKVLYVVNMHQKEEKLSLCSRLSLETESEFKLRTLRWTIARAAVVGNIIWHIYNRHGEIVGRISYFSYKALVRERKGRPGLQAPRTDLFRSWFLEKFALTAWQMRRSVDSSLRNCSEEPDAWFIAIYKILKVFANFTLDNLMILLNSSKTDAISLQATSIWLLRPQACVKWLRIGVSFCFASFRIV